MPNLYTTYWMGVAIQSNIPTDIMAQILETQTFDSPFGQWALEQIKDGA